MRGAVEEGLKHAPFSLAEQHIERAQAAYNLGEYELAGEEGLKAFQAFVADVVNIVQIADMAGAGAFESGPGPRPGADLGATGPGLGEGSVKPGPDLGTAQPGGPERAPAERSPEVGPAPGPAGTPEAGGPTAPSAVAVEPGVDPHAP